MDKVEQHQEQPEPKDATSRPEDQEDLDFDVVAGLIDQIVLDKNDLLREHSIDLVTIIIMELFNKRIDEVEKAYQNDQVDSTL